MKTLFTVSITVLIFFIACTNPNNYTIDLSGEWVVRLDSTNIGEKENWSKNLFKGEIISLPGTLDDASIGTPNKLEPAINNYVMSNLTRKHQYIGKAWYQKEVEIPKHWENRTITLHLERVLWESTVYLDGEKIGSKHSLIGEHQYALNISSGKHTLTIVIDNSNKFPDVNVAGTKYPVKVNQDMAHAYTNHTQIKWNGVLGEITLKASQKNKPNHIQVYPSKNLKRLKITFHQPIKEEKVKLLIKSTENNVVLDEEVIVLKTKENLHTLEIDKPKDLQLWDEFNPKLYDVTVKTSTGSSTTRFGYKVVGSKHGKLTLNKNRIFLRGNLECVIFPLTGYPPTEKEDWTKLIIQAKSYGLNHLRFHSWCPPKAAFQAADEAGFYFQVELPHWSLKFGKDAKTVKFLKEEAHKILEDYGNHPSFILMAMGNELEGDMLQLNNLVAQLKLLDNRHLYTTTAFSFQRPSGTRPEPEDDFFITQWTKNGWIRGQGVFNTKPPHFDADFTTGAAFVDIPLISHEIGQYSVYPDMSEIEKYTGVLKPLNFIAVKNDLKKKGLLDLAPDFTYNSGKLAAILYKEEIERAMKTPSFDGFQLLQLQDFPGQGTALVGLLNAFWESKGVISADEFKQFNSELVPLIRFKKAVYESGEQFQASIEIANFYKPLHQQNIIWKITDQLGNTLAKSQIKTSLTIGNNAALGNIKYDIDTKIAKKLTITLSVQNSNYKNSWNIWVYPKKIDLSTRDVVVTSSFSVAEKALNNGKKVLLNPNFKTLKGIEGRFVPVFWSPVHFPNQPATMGIMADVNHPALEKFPTDTHTDWQWWDLCINSKSVVTNNLQVKPIVRVIDNFVTNNHLANLFEAKVGNGTLVFSSIDLTSELNRRPVARQLRFSLLNYMKSAKFQPNKTITIKELKSLKEEKNATSFSTRDIYNN